MIELKEKERLKLALYAMAHRTGYKERGQR